MNYRWDTPCNMSIAFYRFRNHHKQLNNMYWAFYYGTAVIGKNANISKKAGVSSEDYFKFARDSLEHPHYIVTEDWEKWESAYEEFENLTRINMLLDANSYFEVYLRSIYCLSMESRPDILIGRVCVTDGFSLYKTQKNYHYSDKGANSSSKKYIFYDNLMALTKNDWKSRNSAFLNIYGNIPSELEEYRPQLDEIRKIRNEIGHFFGRNMSDENGEIRLPTDKMIRLSDARLKKFLDIIYRSAKAIDEMLFSNFVGSYECTLFLLQYAQRKSINISRGHKDAIAVEAAGALKREGYILRNTYMCEALDIFLNA